MPLPARPISLELPSFARAFRLWPAVTGWKPVLRGISVVFLLCGAAFAAEGPETKPATLPATTPATQPVGSLTSPREALKWFAAALRDGDVARLQRVMLAADATEERMIRAMGGMSAALADLHAAAVKAFGVSAAEQFTDDGATHFDRVLARIDAATITVHGDAATVRYPDDKPYELQHVKGEWRLPVAQLLKGVSPAVLDRRVTELGVHTRIVNEMTREIAAGKHRSAEAAAMAWRGKMMSAVVTSRPATAPTTKQESGGRGQESEKRR